MKSRIHNSHHTLHANGLRMVDFIQAGGAWTRMAELSVARVDGCLACNGYTPSKEGLLGEKEGNKSQSAKNPGEVKTLRPPGLFDPFAAYLASTSVVSSVFHPSDWIEKSTCRFFSEGFPSRLGPSGRISSQAPPQIIACTSPRNSKSHCGWSLSLSLSLSQLAKSHEINLSLDCENQASPNARGAPLLETVRSPL